MKFVLFLAALGALAYFGSQELEKREGNGPVAPSVQYPMIEADDGVSSVGSNTGGILGN